MTSPAEAFRITAEERALLDGAPFRDVPEDVWATVAGGVHLQVIKAYAEGEMELERVFEIMWACLLGCRLNDRITLLALTARRCLENPPREKKGRRQPNPTWVRYSAASLVQMLREHRPDEPLAPNELNRWTTPILEDAITWLVALRFSERRVTARTLYAWYREAEDAGALEPAIPNTPSNSTSTA